MPDKISVIVPVYNVDRFLNHCVDSILKQTYRDLEIILVDDGTTDKSAELCEEYAQKDGRIVLVHKNNGGLSDARNAGLNVATGQLICFVDGDDWIESNTIQAAYTRLISDHSDIAIWGYCSDFVDGNEQLLNSIAVHTNECLHKKDAGLSASTVNDTFLSIIGYAWNKLYRRDLIKDIRFENGISLVEDVLFNALVLPRASRVSFLSTLGSHYIQRERETLGTKYYPDYYVLKVRACKAREEILGALGLSQNEIEKAMSTSYFAAIKSSCRMACRSSLPRNEKYLYMKKVCASDQAKMDIQRIRVSGKDKFFKAAIMMRQYWFFEALYGR